MMLYMKFIYGFLYLCFVAYPIAFQELRGWSDGVGALPFISITCEVLTGAALSSLLLIPVPKHSSTHWKSPSRGALDSHDDRERLAFCGDAPVWMDVEFWNQLGA